MALNFPNPNTIQTYTNAGITWTWNPTLGVWSTEGNTSDNEFLSKVNDDTASGAITFEGLTTHEGGVSVTGGDESTADISLDGDNLYVAKRFFTKKGMTLAGSDGAVENPLLSVNYKIYTSNAQDNRPETGYIVTRSRASFVSGDSANHVSCFLASTMDGVNNANIQNQYAFYAGKSLSTAFNNYGFYSNLGANGHQGGAAYNFYAADTAPNYFAGDVIIAPNPDKSEILNGTKNGKIIQKSDANLISSRSATVGNTHASFINPNGAVGFIKTINSNLVIEGLAGGPLLLDVDADARKVTSTEELSNASAVVQQLQPVKINGTRHGFTASALEPIFAEAVSGTAGETQAIGTYTPVDGEVEYNVTEPEAIPFGATWEQTGTRDVYQGVDQTKLIPLLTKALQEALTRIEELESNTLQPLYSTFADLPSASDHHGKTAHVHSEGALYFAHAGNWVKLQNA